MLAFVNSVFQFSMVRLNSLFVILSLLVAYDYSPFSAPLLSQSFSTAALVACIGLKVLASAL